MLETTSLLKHKQKSNVDVSSVSESGTSTFVSKLFSTRNKRQTILLVVSFICCVPVLWNLGGILDVLLDNSANIILLGSKKHKEKKAQDVANKQFDKYLNDPSLKGELFYNATHKEYFLRESHEEKNHKSKPPVPPPPMCEATIMIIRHCEKELQREHCAYIGYQRAAYFSTLFGNGDERWPSPTYVYALAADKRRNEYVRNWREVETVLPLSTKLNITINDKYTIDDHKNLAVKLLGDIQSGNMCGKLALICWKHTDIPHLANALGCGPEQGCPTYFDQTDFDSVWQLKFSYHMRHHTTEPELKLALRQNKKNHDPFSFDKHPIWW